MMEAVMEAGQTLQHLRVRRDFLAAAKADKQVRLGLVLQARRRDDNASIRFGLTATKKIGNAVIRNRIKRRLRVLATSLLLKYGHSGFDYVLIGRAQTRFRDWRALQHDLISALKAIHADSA